MRSRPVTPQPIDEAALDFIATRMAPKFGVSDGRQLNCAKGATEISPGLLAQFVAPKSVEGGRELPWVSSHKIILPLLAFERAGCECVFSSDWNEMAQITQESD